jgi:hypothetical protein
MSYLILTTFGYAAVMFALARFVTRRLPFVRRFNAVRKILEDRLVSFGGVSQPTELMSLAQREFQDICAQTSALGVELKHRRVADVVDAVYRRHDEFMATIGELRAQAFILLVLGLPGAAQFLGENNYQFDFHALVHWIDRNPSHALAFIEAAMVVLLTGRLVHELASLRRFLET